ncbi:MAG: universal stress protein [Woeseiaceae bacterium]|nr:universal stress protein [Woeseiaceae bacterium]
MEIPPVFLANDTEDLERFGAASKDGDSGHIILVPVDFSAHSAAALDHAAKLSTLVPSAMVVLHVVHDPSDMPGYYSSLVKNKHFDRMQDAAASAFEDFLGRVIGEIPENGALSNIKPVMVVGLPVTRILEVVDTLEPIMVVMGSQGRTGLKHLIIGSKAEQIIQLCPVPVTIVKDPNARKRSGSKKKTKDRED